jgi:putative transcriptional regulator
MPGGDRTATDGAARVGLDRGCEAREGYAAGRLVSETTYNRIAMLRAERGISRRNLADALGVHYQTVGYLERCEYCPSLYLALKIAEYFEVQVEVIFSTAPFPRIGSGERSA